MTPDDIAATRVLLARGKAAGWSHWTFAYATSPDHLEHVWMRGGAVYGDRVSLWQGLVSIEIPDCSRSWNVPVVSGEQVAAVLELAGALPPAEVLRCDEMWWCPRCGVLHIRPFFEHYPNCPELTPVTVTITRREVSA
jgi:hypothetical protein